MDRPNTPTTPGSGDQSIPTPGHPTDRRALLAGIGGLAAGALLAGKATAGPLNPPPGPIAPTPGPEPRIAVNSTNTPGNANAVFRITESGSYYLERNLRGQAGRHGISIETSFVTLDLAGHSMLGFAASLSGIVLTGFGFSVTIRNGTIAVWGEHGINHTSEHVLIENIQTRNNGGDGIRAMRNTVIRHCISKQNGGAGINAGDYAVTMGCAADLNVGHGLRAGLGSIISNSTSERNSIGISIGNGSSVMDCVAISNNSSGISQGLSSSTIRCTSVANVGTGIESLDGGTIADCNVGQNSGHGISVRSGNTVRLNNCNANRNTNLSSAGIHVTGQDNRIESNNCTGNDRGIRVGNISNFIARNTCSANSTSNWEIDPGNLCFVVGGVPSGAISGNSGGVAGSTDANANFTF